MKLAEKQFQGKNTDLSAFGQDLESWQSIRLIASKQQARIHLNDQLAFETDFSADIGRVIGFHVFFSGNGSVDYLRLKDPQRNKLVYVDEFDDL